MSRQEFQINWGARYVIKNYVFRDLTTSNPVELWQCFGGTCYLHKVVSSWRWRQKAHPKRRRTSNRLHGVTMQKTRWSDHYRDEYKPPTFLKSYWISFERRTVRTFSQNTLRNKHGCQKEELQVKFPYIKNCLDVCLILSYCSVIQFAEHLNI